MGYITAESNFTAMAASFPSDDVQSVDFYLESSHNTREYSINISREKSVHKEMDSNFELSVELRTADMF